jgi:hypothetical protein
MAAHCRPARSLKPYRTAGRAKVDRRQSGQCHSRWARKSPEQGRHGGLAERTASGSGLTRRTIMQSLKRCTECNRPELTMNGRDEAPAAPLR